jgi:hypothetical protein
MVLTPVIPILLLFYISFVLNFWFAASNTGSREDVQSRETSYEVIGSLTVHPRVTEHPAYRNKILFSCILVISTTPPRNRDSVLPLYG